MRASGLALLTTAWTLALLGGCGLVQIDEVQIDEVPINPPPASDAQVDDARSPRIVAEGAFPFRLALDGDDLYWAEFTTGQLFRHSLATGESTELLPARMRADVYGLLVTADYAYVCDSWTGEIHRIEKSSGESAVWVRSPCTDLAVHGAHLFWTSIDEVAPMLSRMPLAGGPVEALSDIGPSRNLLLTEDHLYWTSFIQGEVFAWNAAEGVRSVAQSETNGPWGLSANETFVYWTEFDSAEPGIFREDKRTRTVERFAVDQPGAHSVIVDEGNVYWTNQLEGTLMQLVDGRTRVVAEGLISPQNLALSRDWLIWSSRSGAVQALTRESPRF
ncbi:MAG: hypothetical protein AAF411_11420 [Myxococcota bacterium]